jgi:small ligand-binding sensory domain FIST
VLLFGEPFSFDPEPTFSGLDVVHPGVVVTGGMASGGSAPGAHRLFLDERVHTSGAVCVALSGELEVETVIAQGCRPVGPPMFATGVDGHLLLELDGRSPLDVMQKLHAGASPDVQERMRHALVVGVGLKNGARESDAQELLVRNLVGLEPKRKAVAIAAQLEPLQVIQFMLRDAAAAEADLTERLQKTDTTSPSGALLFSCVGRGRGLFGVDDHDSKLFMSRFAATPLGGFFCNGEFGPVNGRTWMHGFTSAFVLFRPTVH